MSIVYGCHKKFGAHQYLQMSLGLLGGVRLRACIWWESQTDNEHFRWTNV